MKVKLGDICTIKSSKRIFEKEYVPSGIPFIRGQEISDGSIKQKNGKFQCYISKERFDQLKEKNGVPQKNDILITAVGTIGNLFYVDREFDFYFKDGNVIWLTDFNKLVYPKYLYFFMKSQYFLKQLEYAMIGAVQKALTMVMLSKIEFELPSYDKQKRIASWLEIIDNKIDNNNKVISELEKMSKTIYDYWFLQYEFPNEEGKPYKSLGGKMVWNDELGQEIPEGWYTVKVYEILSKVNNSNKLSSSEYKARGKYPIVDQSAKIICGYTDDDNGKIDFKNCIIFGDHTKIVKYIDFDFVRGADGTQVINSNNNSLPNYILYNQIKNMSLVSQGYSRYFCIYVNDVKQSFIKKS